MTGPLWWGALLGERARHGDTFTEHAAGRRRMPNDVVNRCATAGGALLALGLAALRSS